MAAVATSEGTTDATLEVAAEPASAAGEAPPPAPRLGQICAVTSRVSIPHHQHFFQKKRYE
jgi:hypothetical protein